jgi:hypothetical protein
MLDFQGQKSAQKPCFYLLHFRIKICPIQIVKVRFVKAPPYMLRPVCSQIKSYIASRMKGLRGTRGSASVRRLAA